MEKEVQSRKDGEAMKTVLFIDGTKGFSPHRSKEKATGGIITSLTIIPQSLAKRGYKVYVLSAYEKEEVVEGVTYINKNYNIEPDVVVYNRNVTTYNSLNAFPGKKVWWLHDIVDHRYLDDNSYTLIDTVVALSQYNVESYSDFYGIPKHKFKVIPNGVDKSVFHQGDAPRNKHLYIAASAVVKGLHPLEFTYLNLKRHDPDIDFRLYTSQKLHDFDDTERTVKLLEHYKKMGIKVLDPIPQKELADVLRQAWCYMMPNHYPEICSNLLLQAQACGCPVVASNIGSVGEFIEHGKTGLLTHTYPHDMYWWWKDFAEQCVKLQHDEELWKDISLNSLMNPFDWSYITTQWQDVIEN